MLVCENKIIFMIFIIKVYCKSDMLKLLIFNDIYIVFKIKKNVELSKDYEELNIVFWMKIFLISIKKKNLVFKWCLRLSL